MLTGKGGLRLYETLDGDWLSLRTKLVREGIDEDFDRKKKFVSISRIVRGVVRDGCLPIYRFLAVRRIEG